MVQFFLNWTEKDIRVSNMPCGQFISEQKLSNEWKIVCFWNGKLGKSLKPHSLEFRRVTAIDVVTMYGTFYPHPTVRTIRKRGQSSEMPPKLLFHTFMESGSSSKVIDVYDPHLEFNSGLHGDVTITHLTNYGCRKCVHLAELSNDMRRLLEPENCCLADVYLKCGEASIPAHKIILSARSPVFAAMFKNPMKENHENEVVIDDMEVPVLQLMLTYVYTGNLSDLTVSSASDLLYAADKYQLGDLKKVCCEFLKNRISLQNVLRILLLGELHYNELKSRAIDYICLVCKEISVFENTEEWKTLRKERPDLTVDILTAVLKAKERMGKF
ncbi:unnamed protein product [Larinioides sclopetarius]|uniref:BTB domain-containing protein n=1 Tax=Larinioides sclopetarius TaxID=280406 RepID=A0AAV2AAB0_9ARAC